MPRVSESTALPNSIHVDVEPALPQPAALPAPDASSDEQRAHHSPTESNPCSLCTMVPSLHGWVGPGRPASTPTQTLRRAIHTRAGARMKQECHYIYMASTVL